MKLSIRCLSPVTDSSSPKYHLLHHQQQSTPARSRSTLAHRIVTKLRRSLTRIIGRDVVHVPHGHIPVYVGEEMKKFIINAELLTAPVIMELLNVSAQKYGYHQQGALRISCDVLEFERILEAIRRNMDLDSEDFDEDYSSDSYYEGPQ